MRAMIVEELGKPLRLALRPVPEPGACHVRIRVAAAAVNFADTLLVQGRYQEKPALPFAPGLEVAGVVDAVGVGVRGITPGQRVLAILDHGGFAEFALARMEDVVPIPEAMGFDVAAGFAVAYGSAHGGLAWRGALARGETLLVHGAAGGVGLTAVEVGKAMGAQVIATARGREKLEIARAHGADHVLDSEREDLREAIRALAPDGVDVVFDPVGGRLFDIALRAIAWEGRIVIVGFAGGQVPQIPANLLLVKNAAAVGLFWGSYRRHDPERLVESLETLLGWWQDGLLKPHVSHRLPLEQANEALDLLRSRSSTGKVVLTIGGTATTQG
jgi:NADPH2:quinone reductase